MSNERIKKMLPCKQECSIVELRQLFFKNTVQISNILPFFPYPSRCVQNLIEFITNGNQTSIEIKSDIIRSIFSQADPVFYEIYKMANAVGAFNDTNVTFQIDPVSYLNYMNNSMNNEYWYMDINATVYNLTVLLRFC